MHAWIFRHRRGLAVLYGLARPRIALPAATAASEVAPARAASPAPIDPALVDPVGPAADRGVLIPHPRRR